MAELPEDLATPGFEGQSDRRLDLAEALSALKEEDRTLLYLVYGEGFPLMEAALMMQIPLGTVKSRLHTLRGRLRRDLKGEPDDT